MALWAVRCLEDKYPGMWHRWFQHQCVGIGWPPADGWRLDGSSSGDKGWSRARNEVQRVVVGDDVIVTLKNHRVGRLGTVTSKAIEDDQWNPLVPSCRSSKPRRLRKSWHFSPLPATVRSMQTIIVILVVFVREIVLSRATGTVNLT